MRSGPIPTSLRFATLLRARLTASPRVGSVELGLPVAPEAVVDAMLSLAKVTGSDVVYDLGSGDGRIPVTAAKKYGARGVGIDIDPKRIEEANENAKLAGVTDKVKFLNQDLFTTDISEATVVTLYLLPSLNVKLMPKLKAELLTRYDAYITDEVLPLIRNEAGEDARPITTGASLGAFLAANEYFKHPDLFRGVIAMSGGYDIRPYLNGYYDDNVFFNNPLDYLPGLNDDHYLPILRRADGIYILCGQGAYEDPKRSQQLSDILKSKGIPHTLDLWGADVNHDWPWWRKMLPHVLGKIMG